MIASISFLKPTSHALAPVLLGQTSEKDWAGKILSPRACGVFVGVACLPVDYKPLEMYNLTGWVLQKTRPRVRLAAPD